MNAKFLSRRLAILTCLLLSTRLPAHPADRPVELLVKWREGPASLEAADANARLGGVVVRNFNAIGWQQVRLPAGTSLTAGLQAYRRLQSVLEVEPNAPVEVSLPLPPSDTPLHETRAGGSLPGTGPAATHRLSPNLHGPSEPVTPNDPMFGQQWHLRKIDAPAAWATTTGSTNVVVAIIDTGVDYTHPDLAPNMWRNPGETGTDALGRDKATNGVDDDANGYVDDVHGVDVINGNGDPMDSGYFDPPDIPVDAPVYHGTAIAGFIGAVGDNRAGIAGLNWSIQIMAIRSSGGDRANGAVWSPAGDWAHRLAAWDYVLVMKRRGVNIRLTSNSYGNFVQSAALRDAVVAAGTEGILSIFSAGNEAVNTDLLSRFPAAFNPRFTLTVAASTESDGLSSFSNFGPGTVDLAAPGVNMTTTWKGGYQSGGSGTSLACPLVTGVAALLLSIEPELTADAVKAAILGSVDQPAALRGKLSTHGRLNAARAVEYLGEPDPPAIVIAAQPTGRRTDLTASIQMAFSRPMNRASVESVFAITPAVDGQFAWSADARSFSFQHEAPFDNSASYTVRLLGTARDASGGTLSGDFDRHREGSPADDYSWTFRFPVPNDDFADSHLLADAVGSVAGSNRNTTFELLEPDHVSDQTSTSSIWYRWTADRDGWMSFDLTAGTAFDSLLAIYQGDRLDRLTAVAGNDNYGTRQTSRVSFAAERGTDYHVAIAGKSGDITKRAIGPDQTGSYRLSWYPTPVPGFAGSQFSPVRGIPGERVTLTGTNFTGAATVLFGSANADFTNALTNNLDLRITATVPPDATSGPITVVTWHGSVTSTATFQVLPPLLAVRGTPGGLVEISWPATSDAFVLESASTVARPNWAPVTDPILRADGQSRVLVPGAEAARFFRLKAR